MTLPDPLDAVHRQAAAPGVANPNGFARWDFNGEDLELRAKPAFDVAAKVSGLIADARKHGHAPGHIVRALREAAKALEEEPEL